MAKSAEDIEAEKRAVAEWATRLIYSGMRIGLGSGTTMAYFIEALGRKYRMQPSCTMAVGSSIATEMLARLAGIKITDLQRGMTLDLAIDGADEIAPDFSLIKGGGGALLREKILATAAKQFVVIADSSKLVSVLGKFPLPVEVVPFAMPYVMDRLASLGGNPSIRVKRASPEVPVPTDQGNYLVDCAFGQIDDSPQLAAHIREIPGVVEHGLFIRMTKKVVVADGDRVRVLKPHTR